MSAAPKFITAAQLRAAQDDSRAKMRAENANQLRRKIEQSLQKAVNIPGRSYIVWPSYMPDDIMAELTIAGYVVERVANGNFTINW